MTGKQLREFAANVHDDAVIEIREKRYDQWTRDFEMQAPYIFTSKPYVESKDETVT